MIVKTKKHRCTKKDYMRVTFFNLLQRQWWLGLLLFTVSGGVFFYQQSWYVVLFPLLGLSYFAFQWGKFYAITRISQNQWLFEPLAYQISSQQINVIIQDNKQAVIPITWEEIKYARQSKDAFLLFLTEAQFIYLPYKKFGTPYEVQFVSSLLKKKKLI